METYFGPMQETTGRISREKVVEDFKTLARDAEELLRVTAGEVAEKMSDEAKAARARLATALEGTKGTLQQLEDRAIISARAADQVVRSHPYESIGAAFGLGLLIGVLVGRR